MIALLRPPYVGFVSDDTMVRSESNNKKKKKVKKEKKGKIGNGVVRGLPSQWIGWISMKGDMFKTEYI